MRGIIQKIKELENLDENNLKPEEYAIPGGLAEEIVLDIKGGMKINQLRKIFTKIKNIQRKAKTDDEFEQCKNELSLVFVDLAYAAGRNLIPENFFELMKTCLIRDNKLRITTKKEFDNFVKFLEAIIAYYKYHS